MKPKVCPCHRRLVRQARKLVEFTVNRKTGNRICWVSEKILLDLEKCVLDCELHDAAWNTRKGETK